MSWFFARPCGTCMNMYPGIQYKTSKAVCFRDLNLFWNVSLDFHYSTKFDLATYMTVFPWLLPVYNRCRSNVSAYREATRRRPMRFFMKILICRKIPRLSAFRTEHIGKDARRLLHYSLSFLSKWKHFWIQLWFRCIKKFHLKFSDPTMQRTSVFYKFVVWLLFWVNISVVYFWGVSAHFWNMCYCRFGFSKIHGETFIFSQSFSLQKQYLPTLIYISISFRPYAYFSAISNKNIFFFLVLSICSHSLIRKVLLLLQPSLHSNSCSQGACHQWWW